MTDLPTLARRLGLASEAERKIERERNAIECDQVIAAWDLEDDEHPCWKREVDLVADEYVDGVGVVAMKYRGRMSPAEFCPACTRRHAVTQALHTARRRRASLLAALRRRVLTETSP